MWGISDSWLHIIAALSSRKHSHSPCLFCGQMKSGSKTHVCSLPSHMETPLPKETIRGKNLCCLSKQIKFQRCNKTEVWLEAIAEATTDTLPSGFLIKAATAITVWQMVLEIHRIRVIMFLLHRCLLKKHSCDHLFKCTFCVLGLERWRKCVEVKVSIRSLSLCGFHLPEKEKLSSGPLWGNLLRQHIN